MYKSFLVYALTLSSLVPCSNSAIAQSPDTYSANFWVQACEAGADDLCTGYFRGLLDGNEFMTHILNKPWWCLPNGVTTKQLFAVVRAAIKPEKLHEPFGAHAIGALSSKFPCKIPNEK